MEEDLSSFGKAGAKIVFANIGAEMWENSAGRRRRDSPGVKSWARTVELSTSSEELIPQAQHIQSLNAKLIFSLSIFFLQAHNG